MVLDAPATGHGVAILSAPRTFAQAARVGRIARQGRTIDAMLCDPARTGVVAVARPEEMPVNETLALQDALRDDIGLEVELVVCNGMLPQRFTRRRGARARRGARRGPEVRAAPPRPRARPRPARAAAAPAPPGARARSPTLPFVFERAATGGSRAWRASWSGAL